MGLKGLTTNTAPEAEPHIGAEDDAAIYQAICGPDGVFEIGQKCESQVISNNKVRVKDGVVIVGGHFARIPYGEYVDCEIANGQSGKKRNDIIIAKFVTTGSGGIDTMTCEVKQGTAVTGTATDPALTQNDLYQGGKIRELPLYRVKIDGLSITKVEPMFDLIPTIPTLNASLSDLSAEKEPVQKKANSGCYYKNGYNCFLHAADEAATDVIKTLSAAYRPRKAVTVSGWCYNDNSGGWYPCIGGLRADGTWAYVSAINELGQSVPYYIYNVDQSVDRRSYFRLWLTGAWATNANGA